MRRNRPIDEESLAGAHEPAMDKVSDYGFIAADSRSSE
jgi:hypothetical protein